MPHLPNSSVGEMSYKVSALTRPLLCDREAAVLEASPLTLVKSGRANREAYRPTAITGRGVARRGENSGCIRRAGFNSA